MLLALALPAAATQDLDEKYVTEQVKTMVEKPGSPAAINAHWTLLAAGLAAVYPLGAVARKHDQLAWTAVHVLDAIRTDAHVLRLFSEFLDKPPAGLKSTGEVAGFLSSRLADMLPPGVALDTDEARRRWLKAHSDFLVYEPAELRFYLDKDAMKTKRFLIPTPQRKAAHAKASAAYGRLLAALHVGHLAAAQRLAGPRCPVVKKGGRTETAPELDIDAFSGPMRNHRALTLRHEGGARWLVRSGAAYFFFDGDQCTKAGMKPID